MGLQLRAVAEEVSLNQFILAEGASICDKTQLSPRASRATDSNIVVCFDYPQEQGQHEYCKHHFFLFLQDCLFFYYGKFSMINNIVYLLSLAWMNVLKQKYFNTFIKQKNL